MSGSGSCIELYEVDKEAVLNFWNLHVHEAVGPEWDQVRRPVRSYLLTVLSHFCLEPQDRALVRSEAYKPGPDEFRQFADLSQIAEFMMSQLISASPTSMESAGAHILLYAGFFRKHSAQRHYLPTFTSIGRDCYRMAAVGERERVLRQVAAGFAKYLLYLSTLHDYLSFKRYLIN